MCLEVNKALTERIKTQLSLKGYIYAYKVVRVRIPFTDRLQKVPRSLYRNGYRWKTGWNSSSRKTAKLSCDESATRLIRKGIHVYLDRNAFGSITAGMAGNGITILRVKCYKKDFVSAGGNGLLSISGEAVFAKVYVNKTDYARTMKEQEPIL